MQSISLGSSPFLTQVHLQGQGHLQHWQSIRSPKALKEGLSPTTVLPSISSFSVLSLATVPWMHLFHFPARALSLCYTPWFILSCFQAVLLSHPERESFCAPEEPRAISGCLCVPNDLGSVFICAFPVPWTRLVSLLPPHDVSCHCDSLREESPLLLHLWAPSRALMLQCHGQEPSGVPTPMQNADLTLAPAALITNSYHSWGFPTGFCSCLPKSWPMSLPSVSQTAPFGYLLRSSG